MFKKRKNVFLGMVVFLLLMTLAMVNSASADSEAGRMSLGIYNSGFAALGFGISDAIRIDAGLSAMTLAQGTNTPVTIGGIFYYNFNPKVQNVMHAIGSVQVTFLTASVPSGYQIVQRSYTLITVGAGLGWEFFINHNCSVNADLMIASITFGGETAVYSVLAPELSAHYYF